ncbi:hypothetical protein BQ8482_380205 [Mesorhizobium delmotii]|uniref:Uncharacterized protein n=1 Tax=Mesorhizobium delmotii TaxID=1631247 RepID=A0A2P9AS96_9HYPH|nr:hypothetical protein BQ8482_380205 [Mesorhizobium delmotii]
MSLDISVDAHRTQAAMPKRAPGRMMDECAVVVPRRVLNRCDTRAEIFFGMQESIAENAPDCRNDPDCPLARRYHAPALAIGVSR